MLNEVLLAFRATALAAFPAHTLNDHSMTANAKSLFRSDLIPNLRQCFALELEQLATARAIQVIVLRISVIKFVDSAAVQLKAFQQPCIDEFAKRAIDRRRTDIILFATARQAINQLVSVKVIMLPEDGVDQELALAGLTQPSGL